MNNTTAALLMGFGVLLACTSQILLKKSASIARDAWYKNYLNWRVMTAYVLLFISTLCSVGAYRILPLTVSPLFCAGEQIVVIIFSVLFLKEHPSKQKIIGISLIVFGMCVFLL